MKAILVDKWLKGIEDISVSTVPNPEPSEDKVLVQVVAAGVNFIDQLYIRGKHQNNRHITPPFILGTEFASIILSSPADSSFKPGDSVFGASLGSYAEQVAVPISSLHLIPNGWSFAEAAGLAATAPVSHGALILRAGLKKGETVLVHGAAGGLGLMAVQIAKAVGARVIATSASDEKLEVTKRFGADEGVNYSEGMEWREEVLRLTEGRGVDVVYDSVGLVNKSLKCLAPMGRILIIGFAGTEGAIEKIAMNRVLLRQAQLIGYRMGMTAELAPKESEEVWKQLKVLLDQRQLLPTVYPKLYVGLESVKEAMEDLQSRKVWGKPVVIIEPQRRETSKL